MTKISDLIEDTSISDDDIVYKVDDPGGTPLSRKITWANIKAVLKIFFDGLYPSGSGTSTGSNTGDNAVNSLYSGLEASKEDVANKSTNVVTDGLSDIKYPSVKSIKDYADSLVSGLLDYRGAYDASVNTFPTTGGSGTAGAILKGDMWIISVAGTLGGEDVQIGDSIIANVDTPGQTATNWNILNSNIAYVPEDVANKSTTLDTDKASDIKYSSTKSIYDWATGLFATLTGAETFTNKRITERVNTITSSATPTPAGDTTDLFTVTALAANATFAAPTGTPTNGQVLLIRIKDNGSARTLAWNAIYRASSDLALPTTTVISKTLYLQFVYNSTDSKWDLLGLLDNF